MTESLKRLVARRENNCNLLNHTFAQNVYSDLLKVKAFPLQFHLKLKLY